MPYIFFDSFSWYTGVNFGLFALVNFAIGLMLPLQLGLLIFSLMNLVKKKHAPAEDKILWVLIIVFINIIGPIVYFVFGSKMLDEKIDKKPDESDENSAENSN